MGKVLKFMPPKDFRGMWEARRKANQQRTVCEVIITKGRVQVMAPRSAAFVKAANALGGRWRYRSWIWSFQGKQLDAVMELCLECFEKVIRSEKR